MRVFIQQDWFMRQIEMILTFVTRLFGADSSQSAASPEADSAGLTQKLTDLLGEGQLGKAEDLLFQQADSGDKSVLVSAVAFYRQANALTDSELAAQDFTREELLEGLGEIISRYGLELPDMWEDPPGAE